MKPLLYAAPGTGSALAEAMLALAGVPYDIKELDYEKDVVGGNPELRKVNPLSRVPTLVLENGEILTESGAIALHLGSRPGGDRLVPPASAPSHAKFLRLLFFINSEIYPCFTFADIPSEWVSPAEAQKQLKDSISRHQCELWQTFENWVDPEGPWVLGSRMSALDIYCAVMTNWRPRRAWFEQHCPRVMRSANRISELPELRAIFERNF